MRNFSMITAMLLLVVSNVFSATYYSRQDGAWSSVTTWSTTGHGGVAAASVPGTGDYIYIGDSDNVTLDQNLNQPGISLEVYGGASLIGDFEIYIKVNGIFKVGESGTGTININHLLVKQNATVYVYSDGSVTTSTYVDNNQNITVDGELIIGTEFINDGVVSGTGTITAATYSGVGTTFGIANSTITAGSTVSGYTWDGDQADSEWNTADNWAAGSSPSASTHNVVIPSGLTYYPIITTSAEACDDLVIETGASLTIGPGGDLSVSGTLTSSAAGGIIINSTASGTGSLYHTSDNVQATIKRYITGNSDLGQDAYHLVSVPLDASNTNLYSNLFLESYLFDFDESASTSGDWYSYGTSTTTALPVTQGYMIYYPGSNKTYSFAGKLNNGSFSCSVGYSDASHGYNLVPNPYSFDIDWDAASGWTKTNIGASIWIWNPGHATPQYYTWNGTTGSLGDGKIAVGQSFLVRASGSPPALQLTNAIKTTGATFYKSGNSLKNHLKIKAVANGFEDQAFVHFTSYGSFEKDPANDTEKLFGANYAPQLYTLADEELLSINTLPFSSENVLVPLCLEYNSDDICTFYFEDLDSFAPTTSIELQDLATGDIINLRQNPIYLFEYNTDYDPERFILHFNGITKIYDKEQPWANIYKYGDKLFINSIDNEIKNTSLEIFNSSGQKILSEELNIYGNHIIDFNYPSGLYIVVLTKNNKVIKRKIIDL